MYDWMKLKVGPIELREHLRRHPKLEWKPADKANQARRATEEAQWGEFTFLFNPYASVYQILGSFHKQVHGGENWEDFTYPQFAKAVKSLERDLGLSSKDLHLLRLEIGVNLKPLLPTADMVPCFIGHRTSLAKPMRHPAIGVHIKHHQFYFKIYDKAAQYGLPDECMRVEVHVKRMALLKPYGVRSLDDLMDRKRWRALGGYLLKRCDEVLFIEPEVEIDGLRPAQVEMLARVKRKSYWMEVRTPQRRAEVKAALKRIYARCAQPQHKAELKARMETKLKRIS